MWSEQGLRSADERVAGAGEWDWAVSTTDIGWWDTSSDLNGTEFVGGVLAEAYTPPAGVTWTNTWTDDWDATVGGYPISLSTYRIVPGDTVTGKFTIDANLTALDGQNLRAQVTAAAYADGTAKASSPLVVDSVTTSDNEVTVVVSYPASSSDYANEAGQPLTVDLGDYTVTLTQVRP